VTASLPAGPYRSLDVDGSQADWYMVPFDKSGRCQGPRTRDELVRASGSGEVTDVFLFSHGWNNDWATATTKYEQFLTGFGRMRRDHGLEVGREFRPLLAGVFWPSTALVGPGEQAPTIAADPSSRFDTEVAQERADVAEVAALLPEGSAERFYDLVQQDSLGTGDAEELAAMVLPVLGSTDDDTGGLPGDDDAGAAELAALWRRLPDLGGGGGTQDPGDARAELEDFGRAPTGDRLDAAGLLGRIRPRDVLRSFTMWLMKDRAGVVGSGGVADLLLALLDDADGPRVHLVGHSFGAKVCLSALCHPDRLPRPVSSVLLLQPAVSHLCFADRVPGTDRPGGYAAAPSRSVQPVLSTFSSHDVPLTRLFHLAARRRDDLAEVRIAGDEPDRYAALGGVGPRHAPRCRTERVKDVGDGYDLGADAKASVYGVDASRTVLGHSDISNASTHWALFDLVRSS
jgi:pimeloyl-ACP methyl ester carboxylesterase